MKLTGTILSLLLLGGCAHAKQIRPTETLLITGTDDQISALLSDKEARVGPTVKLLSDTHTKTGRRELKYGMSDTTPYRDIGGMVFYAQVHGNKVEFEKRR